MFVVLVLTCVVLLSACDRLPFPSDEPEAATPVQTRTVSDGAGEIAIPVKPRRIVVLWAPTLSAVTQLGFDPAGAVGDPQVHDGGLIPYVPEDYPLEQVSIVAAPGDLQVRHVAALEPDLILGADVEELAAHRDQLSRIAPTVLLPWEGPTSWQEHFADVAEVLGAQERAQEVVRQYEARVQEVQQAIGSRSSAVEISLLRVNSPDAVLFGTPSSFSGQVIADVGLDQIASQERFAQQPYVAVPHDRLAVGDGDVLFVMHDDSQGEVDAALDVLTSQPEWADLQAVRRNRDFDVSYDSWGAPSYVGAHQILADVEEALT